MTATVFDTVMFKFNASKLFLYVFGLSVLASCMQLQGNIYLSIMMSRKIELDNYVLDETKFRIQAIHEVSRPQCVHQCMRHGNECEGVLVNEILQYCWLLMCSMNQRFIQKGFMEMASGWNFYVNDNGRYTTV